MDKALEDSEGLRWIRERLGAYDWSKADWISVRRGRSETYAFRGVCKMPRNGSGYRINCNVSEHAAYPIYQRMRVSPLYRNPDGTWPKAPEGHKAGEEVQITGFGTFPVRERKAREGRNPADRPEDVRSRHRRFRPSARATSSSRRSRSAEGGRLPDYSF